MTTKNAESCSTSSNTLTTVKTVYARAAVVLLALNFCLTSYVVLNINNTTQAQIDGILGEPAEATPLSQPGGPPQPLAVPKPQENQGVIPSTRENQ